jgi:3-deoxy-D-manno-octulosonic-acid transferase
MRIAYEVLLYLVFLLSLPYFAVVGFLRGKYLANVPERLGWYRSERSDHDVWLHAVSVGEVIAAKPVIDALLTRRPETTFIVTTTTDTGQATARRLFPHASVTYFPIDFSFAVSRFLSHHQPRVFATMETEIWPNVTRLAAAQGMRLVLANGRLSDRSFPRYRALRSFVRPILARYDAILVRAESDRERFVAIGASRAKVSISGNVKFDYQLDPSPLAIEPAVLEAAAGRPIFVAGSTIEGEDELLVATFEALIAAGTFVVVAPRKPERFEIVAALLAASGFRTVRRTDLEGFHGAADLLLLDSIGELGRLYRLGASAFVGGSLVPAGGHNPIEPAAAGVPVAFGPHMSNFREIARAFLDGGGASEVASPDELLRFVLEMNSDPARREELGSRARQIVDANRGAASRTAAAIMDALS